MLTTLLGMAGLFAIGAYIWAGQGQGGGAGVNNTDVLEPLERLCAIRDVLMSRPWRVREEMDRTLAEARRRLDALVAAHAAEVAALRPDTSYSYSLLDQLGHVCSDLFAGLTGPLPNPGVREMAALALVEALADRGLVVADGEAIGQAVKREIEAKRLEALLDRACRQLSLHERFIAMLEADVENSLPPERKACLPDVPAARSPEQVREWLEKEVPE